VTRTRHKLNCWEFKNCGREKGGLLVDQLGECPVASALSFDGHNGGIAAGRACWMVATETRLCCNHGGGRRGSCQACEFYRRVMFDEESNASFRYSAKPV